MYAARIRNVCVAMAEVSVFNTKQDKADTLIPTCYSWPRIAKLTALQRQPPQHLPRVRWQRVARSDNRNPMHDAASPILTEYELIMGDLLQLYLE